MILNQNEILSLGFTCIGFDRQLSMKDIENILFLLERYSYKNEHFEYYMPRHNDFDLKMFKENSENGNYIFLENTENYIKIQKNILNIIIKDKISNRVPIVVRKFKEYLIKFDIPDNINKI